MTITAVDHYPLVWRRGFRHWNLSRQFGLAGGIIMLLAMVLAGAFTSNVVSRMTIESTAAATSLFLDSILTPLVQELATADKLRPENLALLDNVLKEEQFAQRFPHLEIWKEGGLIAYSTTPDLIGRKFPPPEGLVSALAGDIAARRTDLHAGEHTVRNFDKTFLEIYVPVREDGSGRIIAVAEIHEVTAPLERKLWEVRANSWVAIAGSALFLMAGLFGVVYRGSRLIEVQQLALRERIEEISAISDQNRRLRQKGQRASSRVAEMNESYLRHIGAELHDGPAQLVGLASLKTELIRRAATTAGREKELQALEMLLSDTLKDIRTLSKGLMLPEIQHLSLCDIIGRVAKVHRKRTGTKVAVQCHPQPAEFSHALKICVYRFVQEGLNNAFRHAGGEGQTVRYTIRNSILEVAVWDKGGNREGCSEAGTGLGLQGLRERVESLGGTFDVLRDKAGMTIRMRIDLTGELSNDFA